MSADPEIARQFAAVGLPIVYLDAALVVVNKPSGLLSVPGRGADHQDCVVARAQAILAEALIVHRLDMETSGLMLLARGKEVQRRLSIAFQERHVDKAYQAVVDGQPAADYGEIDLPLITDWPNRPRQIVDFELGKPSFTRYRVLAKHGDRARVALEPKTGRSHQLRVHMQALGHPILGDALYAHPSARAKATRLLLHATRLDFQHPLSGQALQLASEAPF